MFVDPYLANVTIFAGNFAPRSWMFCHGQMMSIAQNTALFSLIGTTYGGDGQVTFGLPNFCGRSPMGTGQGPGLSFVDLGQVSGTPTVTLISSNLAPHTHTVVTSNFKLNVNGNVGGTATPSGNTLGTSSASVYNNNFSSGVFMAPSVTNAMSTVNGSSSPVNIMMPYLALNFIIAVEGIYPSRN